MATNERIIERAEKKLKTVMSINDKIRIVTEDKLISNDLKILKIKHIFDYGTEAD